MISAAFIKDFRAVDRYCSYYTKDTGSGCVVTSVKGAAKWLLLAQAKSADGDGYSRSFSLFTGWDKGYPETTGYIIPSMLECARFLNDSIYKESALRAGEWLLSRQLPEGCFCDMDTRKPLAFDTGQILLGLIALFRVTQEKKYEEAVYKSARWLAGVMDEDGSWSRYGYLSSPHAYYSRVSWALYDAGGLLNVEEFRLKARKNISWILSQQLPNGFFEKAGFGGVPFLHTLMYVLEGLIEYYKISSNQQVMEAILKNASEWKKINMDRDIILYSKYNRDFRPTLKEKCISGLAQWAGVCLDLYEVSGDYDYFICAVKTLYYLKNKQIKTGENVRGAFSGSIPYWGSYGRFCMLNWSSKFFIDALLKYSKGELPEYKEQELWACECFRFNSKVVFEDLSFIDRQYIKNIEPVLKSYEDKEAVLLDLGCGRGKFLRYLSQRYPGFTTIGVDPVFKGAEFDVKQGSVYNIPLSDNSVDIVILIEVLQHIEYMERALGEIKRVLKHKGLCIIGERNPCSGLGFMKPALERTGLWMYPPDSPFKERWYSRCQWESMLENSNLQLMKIAGIDAPSRILKKKDRFCIIIAEANRE